MRRLRAFTDGLKPDFVLHGRNAARGLQPLDERRRCCHSVTNYECYKGLYSSFNSMNLFEIGHSLAAAVRPGAVDAV